MILLANSEGPDQTTRMLRLIWVFRPHMPEDMFLFGVAQFHYVEVLPYLQ